MSKVGLVQNIILGDTIDKTQKVIFYQKQICIENILSTTDYLFKPSSPKQESITALQKLFENEISHVGSCVKMYRAFIMHVDYVYLLLVNVLHIFL